MLAFLIASLPLFVFPSPDKPRRVDAIFVLGGPGKRVAEGLRLARQGYAPTLVISSGGQCTWTPPSGVRLICFRPNPFTTQGEARYAAELSRRNHWQSLIVVAGTSQLTRARIRFDRCTKVHIAYVGAEPRLVAWPYQIAYEWAALTKALVWQRGC